jgi:hypothetical protein
LELSAEKYQKAPAESTAMQASPAHRGARLLDERPITAAFLAASFSWVCCADMLMTPFNVFKIRMIPTASGGRESCCAKNPSACDRKNQDRRKSRSDQIRSA